MERIMLVRPLTGELLHPEIEVKPGGEDATKNSLPGAIKFSVTQDWHQAVAEDDGYYFQEYATLVVVERANRTIRSVGLVDKLTPENGELKVSAGGFSMLAGMSGPWEGHQGWFTSTDPVDLFRDVWGQVQSYDNANLGIRVTGDTSSGSMVGSVGSARWRQAYRDHRALKPEVDRLQGRLLDHERVLSQREEAMFRMAGLKRVGSVTVAEARPDDPGYKADSTLWVRESDRLAHVWYEGRWNANRNANDAVAWWFTSTSNLEKVKAELDEAQYAIAPVEEDLERYEAEARDEYSLYFWQNHNMQQVIEDLMVFGPFEYREKASWVVDEHGDDRLDLQLEVGSPRVGVRRPELRLELGHNIHGTPQREYGDTFTGVAMFGAGQGSEVLSAQRDWNPAHVVRNILTETDKDAHSSALTRAAANDLRDRTRSQEGLRFTSLTVHHDESCPEGAFDEGDELFVTGVFPDGTTADQWVRVAVARHPWGTKTTVIEVENV